MKERNGKTMFQERTQITSIEFPFSFATPLNSCNRGISDSFACVMNRALMQKCLQTDLCKERSS